MTARAHDVPLTRPRPVVGVLCCSRQHPDGLTFHRVYDQYVKALALHARVLPVLVPLVPCGRDGDLDDLGADEIIAHLDGLLLPGSSSSLGPEAYDAPVTGALKRDPSRDSVALPLIRAAIAKGLPMLGICRGLQEMNVALGGSLLERVHEVPGRMNHRRPPDVPNAMRYGPAHTVTLEPNGLLADLTADGTEGAATFTVNSLHNQAVDRLGHEVTVEAFAPDGTVEAIRVGDRSRFALAVQWHPEWHTASTPHYRALFAGLGAACLRFRESTLRRGSAAHIEDRSA